MAKRKSKKTTLIEFKAWLEGIEEMQPNNWSPDSEQWKVIRAKFDSIISEPQKEAHPPAHSNVRPAPTRLRPNIPMAASAGNIPENAEVEMSPAAKKMFESAGAPGENAAGRVPALTGAETEHSPAGSSTFE